MTTALATTETGQDRQGFSREQIDLLKRTICAGATDDELKLFIATTERLSLDPFARQVFAVKRWDSRKRCDVMSIQVSIDGFRLVAERTGHYAGQLGPFWTDDGKDWLEVWLKDSPPAAAKVAVLRNDFKEPLWAVATWAQYKQEGQQGLTPMWKKMGPLMLAKCAESLALRRAFPNELSGVYTAEEMAQATPVDEPVTAKPQKQQRPQDPRAVENLGPTDLHADRKEAAPAAPKAPVVDVSVTGAQASAPIAATADTGSRVIDTGEAATDEQKERLRGHAKRLGWKQHFAKMWLAGLFGFKDVDALSKDQCTNAILLAEAFGTDKYQPLVADMRNDGLVRPEQAA